MKTSALILAFGVIAGTASGARAQKAPAPPDPLSDLQADFGAIVGEAFRRPDPVVAAVSGPGSPARGLGEALRTSMEVPGAVFAGVVQPFADADKAATPAPAPVPAPQQRRHARTHHHRVAAR